MCWSLQRANQSTSSAIFNSVRNSPTVVKSDLRATRASGNPANVVAFEQLAPKSFRNAAAWFQKEFDVRDCVLNLG